MIANKFWEYGVWKLGAFYRNKMIDSFCVDIEPVDSISQNLDFNDPEGMPQVLAAEAFVVSKDNGTGGGLWA